VRAVWWWLIVAAATLGLTKVLAAEPRQAVVADGLTAVGSDPMMTARTQVVPPLAPITGKQRVTWIVKATIGPQSLAGGVWSAGLGSARNVPAEYGRGWDGFAQRYGMRLTGVSVGNAIEGSLGAASSARPASAQGTDSGSLASAIC
jgi:hypothetical protein